MGGVVVGLQVPNVANPEPDRCVTTSLLSKGADDGSRERGVLFRLQESDPTTTRLLDSHALHEESL